jgi:indole-3-glycerol phosphate synthase
VGALDDIIAGVRQDLAARQQQVPLERLKERCQHVDPAIDPMPRFRGPGVGVIAEVKRSSPSKERWLRLPIQQRSQWSTKLEGRPRFLY